MVERYVMSKARRSLVLASLCLVASLLHPTLPASAAESIPPLQYPAIPTGRHETMMSGPSGSVTLACSNTGPGVDLVTYGDIGAATRKIDRTQVIDGVTNCITKPVIDKNGTLYGIPYGRASGGAFDWGPNLLAYNGSELKWKYPARCGSNSTPIAVGANGNIYTTQYMTDGLHLIGLTPEIAPGQTQPSKILDIKIANDCSVEFFPYRDGLLLRGQSSGFKYYSYAGKLLAEPQVNRFWEARIGAHGALFDYKFVSGNTTSTSVSTYDPLTGQVAWTTSASTPGANVQSISLHPLQGGGVTALIKEQKMVSDGIPASPTTYIFNLTILSNTGQKIRTVEIPSKDASGNVFMSHRIVSGDNGKLAIVSDVELTPSYSSAISVRVFDVVTGSWTHQQLMSGDANKPGGPSGFYTDRGPVNSDNTLFLIAQCSGNCAVYQEKKLYALKMLVGLGLDYPRGTVLEANTPAQPTPAPYVAMGDSYSSGQGAFAYDGGTTTSNKCYRSANAYGRLLHLDPKSPFSLGGFVACGGAITSDIYATSTYPGVARQDTALTSHTRLVTITIGGNDIGFSSVVETCANPFSNCEDAFTTAHNKLPSLNEKLQHAYRSILEKAPQAKLYVLGYPPIVVAGPGCPVGDRSDYPFFTEERKQKGVELLASLNKVIRDNVDLIAKLPLGNQRIHYIDAVNGDSPFLGHDVCAAEPFVHGLRVPPNDSSESFHPNVKGQGSYAQLAMTKLN